MVVLHICPLSDDLCNGVHNAVPCHVKAQRAYADAALWNLGQPLAIDGLEQCFSADLLDALPAPYRKPDLVVFHEIYIPRYLALSKELRSRRIPYVIVPHGALKKGAQQKSRLKKAAANLLLFKRFCNGAAGIQCLTEIEKQESVMGKNLFVAPNGVEMPAVTKASFRTDETHFVYIGRILPFIKGLDLMIQAFALEKDFLREHRCRLDIYGPTEDRGVSFVPEMQAYIRQGGVEDLVNLHSSVVREEKQRVLLDSDIFIQTSRTEGMPMGILEALSYGLPCLVTEGTTFAQTIQGNNAGWNGGTCAQTIAEALCSAVNSRSRFGEMSANAIHMAEDHSWDSAAAAAIGHYQECLKER